MSDQFGRVVDDAMENSHGISDEHKSEEQNHSVDQLALLQQLLEEERILLDELIQCRTVNRCIREAAFLSARLSQILSEIDEDQSLQQLVDERNDLQNRIEALTAPNMRSNYQRQELLHLPQPRRANFPRPDILPSIAESMEISPGGSTLPLRAQECPSLPANLMTRETTTATLPQSATTAARFSSGNISLGGAAIVPSALYAVTASRSCTSNASPSKAVGGFPEKKSKVSSSHTLRRSPRLKRRLVESVSNGGEDERKPPASKLPRGRSS